MHWFFREQHQQALLAYYYEISLLYKMHDFDSFLRKVRYVLGQMSKIVQR